jgi:hypothetical protein
MAETSTDAEAAFDAFTRRSTSLPAPIRRANSSGMRSVISMPLLSHISTLNRPPTINQVLASRSPAPEIALRAAPHQHPKNTTT